MKFIESKWQLRVRDGSIDFNYPLCFGLPQMMISKGRYRSFHVLHINQFLGLYFFANYDIVFHIVQVD